MNLNGLQGLSVFSLVELTKSKNKQIQYQDIVTVTCRDIRPDCATVSGVLSVFLLRAVTSLSVEPQEALCDGLTGGFLF